MTNRGLLRAAARGAGTCAAVMVCLVALTAAVGGLLGWRPVVVLTGSMGEAVPTGSLALAAPTDHVRVGDVVVMRAEGRPTITHRVVGLAAGVDGRAEATTRGDANPDVDPTTYAVGDRELTVRRVVPGLGRALVALRSPALGGALVAVLVLVFLGGALRRIWGRAPVAPAPPQMPREASSTARGSAAGRAVGRERWSTAVAAGAGAAIVGVTATLALYTATATADANQFSTRACYDARLQGVQRGSVSSSTDGTTSIAIAPVDPARAFVLFSASSAAAEPDESSVSVRLASATSLDVVRASDGAPPGTVEVEWSVVEYACGVSVQRGVATTTGSVPLDVPVTAVDPATSFVVAGVLAPRGATAFDGDLLASATLLDADTLRITASGPLVAGAEVAWQVVSFDDPADAGVQRVTASLPAGIGSTTVALPSTVSPASTFVVASVRSPNTGAAVGDRMVRVRLLDEGTIEVRRDRSTGSVDVDVEVVELRDGSTVQHGVLDLAVGQSSATASTAPVTVTRSTVVSTVVAAGGLGGGSTSMGSDDVVGEGSVRARLIDSRTVELRRGATSTTASFAWQVVTWGGPGWADLQSPFRRRIDVVASSVNTPDGYTTSLTFDHAAMVAAGQSLASGDDVRIWRHDGVTWTEIDRVIDDASAWNASDTTVWFRTREPIAAGETVSYWMYLGDQTPGPVLADPADVWLAVEGFEGGLGIFQDRTGGTGWYDAAPWTRRYVLTVPAGTATADLTDQPVLVRITDPALTTFAQADGSDLRFVAADGVTPLAHELEAYDTATGSVTAWVRLPSIAAATATTFQMYAGATDAPAQQRPRDVWIDAVAAWQLAADPAGPAPALDDSGPARLDGVALADAVRVDTPIGPGASLDGTLDRLESTPFLPPRAAVTVAAVLRLDDDTRDQVLVAHGDPTTSGAFELAVEPSVGPAVARVRIRLDDQVVEISGGSLSTATWHHVAATWDGTTARLFVDGAQVATAPAAGSLVVDAPIPAVLGAAPDGSRAFDGVLAQVRLDDAAWSAEAVDFAATNTVTNAASVTVGAATTGTWFDQGGWAERRPLSIESDLVAGPLTDYPVLVQVVDPDLATSLRADAADLVFTAADGITRLDHQVESWNPTTGALTAWVRVPAVDDTTDALLYAYLANPTATDQQDPVGVWGPDADLVLLD